MRWSWHVGIPPTDICLRRRQRSVSPTEPQRGCKKKPLQPPHPGIVKVEDRFHAENIGPLIPDDSSMAERWLRRARGIVLILVMFVLVTALSPLLVLGALLTDLALWVKRRKPWMALRLAAMLWWFLLGELYGLAGLVAIGVASGGRDSHIRRQRVFRLKRRWLGSHLGAVKVLFGLRFEAEGLELAGPG